MTVEAPIVDYAGFLRRGAALARGTAEAATPAPWWSDESESCWRLHGTEFWTTGHPDLGIPSQPVNRQILKAPKHSTPYAEYWPTKADGDHIVLWHPTAAVAVADLLDHTADLVEHQYTARRELREMGEENRPLEEWEPGLARHYRRPLAIAAALLREEVPGR